MAGKEIDPAKLDERIKKVTAELKKVNDDIGASHEGIGRVQDAIKAGAKQDDKLKKVLNTKVPKKL